MDRKDHVFNAGYMVDDACDNAPKLVWGRVTDGVRDIKRGRAGFDGLLQHHVQKIGIASAGVFRAKLDVITKRTRVLHHLNHPLDDFFRIHAQLVFHMDL